MNETGVIMGGLDEDTLRSIVEHHPDIELRKKFLSLLISQRVGVEKPEKITFNF